MPTLRKNLWMLLTAPTLTFALFMVVIAPSCSVRNQQKTSQPESGQSKQTPNKTQQKNAAHTTPATANGISGPPSPGEWVRNHDNGSLYGKTPIGTSIDLPDGPPSPGNCPKQCTWNGGAPKANQCWTYLNNGNVVGYSDQTVNGKQCAWVRNHDKETN